MRRGDQGGGRDGLHGGSIGSRAAPSSAESQRIHSGTFSDSINVFSPTELASASSRDVFRPIITDDPVLREEAVVLVIGALREAALRTAVGSEEGRMSGAGAEMTEARAIRSAELDGKTLDPVLVAHVPTVLRLCSSVMPDVRAAFLRFLDECRGLGINLGADDDGEDEQAKEQGLGGAMAGEGTEDKGDGMSLSCLALPSVASPFRELTHRRSPQTVTTTTKA